MKILVIESRSNVVIWDEVFKDNLNNTVETHFLIFNSFFASKYGVNHYVKKVKSEESEIDVPIQFDRQRNFFGSSNTEHYSSYYKQISNIINKIMPDFVIGESASFQDYLSIKVCREANILYVNPMTSRYPLNRFAFYKEDTLVPYMGSQESIDRNQLTTLLESIVSRDIVPDYMKKKNYNFSLFKRSTDLKTKLFSYVKGDPNTPPVYHFISRTLKLNKIKKEWSKKACDNISGLNKGINVLYAMQMQPESNIDVYGAPFNNQLEIIKNISKHLSSDDILYVKPNPKPFMEISMALVEFAEKTDRVKLLTMAGSMNEVFPKVDLIITVTGTVAIEAILANKPIGVFKETYFNKIKNCFQIREYDNLSELFQIVRNNEFPMENLDKRLDYLNYLNKISYPGRISFVNLNEKEIIQIKKSVRLFINQIKRDAHNNS